MLLLFYWRNTFLQMISGRIRIWQFNFHAQITTFPLENSSFFSFPECSKRRRRKKISKFSLGLDSLDSVGLISLWCFSRKKAGSETQSWSQNHVSPLNWMKQKEGNWSGKKGVFLFKQVFCFSCFCSMSAARSLVEIGVWRKLSSHLL